MEATQKKYFKGKCDVQITTHDVQENMIAEIAEKELVKRRAEITRKGKGCVVMRNSKRLRKEITMMVCFVGVSHTE